MFRCCANLNPDQKKAEGDEVENFIFETNEYRCAISKSSTQESSRQDNSIGREWAVNTPHSSWVGSWQTWVCVICSAVHPLARLLL
jgi:hypothetical protein